MRQRADALQLRRPAPSRPFASDAGLEFVQGIENVGALTEDRYYYDIFPGRVLVRHRCRRWHDSSAIQDTADDALANDLDD